MQFWNDSNIANEVGDEATYKGFSYRLLLNMEVGFSKQWNLRMWIENERGDFHTLKPHISQQVREC